MQELPMVARQKPLPFETIADLVEQLGGIEPRRIRANPPPGTATEKDVLAIHDRTNRLFELVDGVLVEKVMCFAESFLALELAGLLRQHIPIGDLGILVGADGMVRLMPGLVRMPDLAFLSWSHFPGRKVPRTPIPQLAPDLAVEVLSVGNTPAEMRRKLREYFFAGVRVVWLVNPDERTVRVYSAPNEFRSFGTADILDGGEVLPGLALPVRDIFARLGPFDEASAGPADTPGRRSKKKRS
jgi:Uma2 family endonuclease